MDARTLRRLRRLSVPNHDQGRVEREASHGTVASPQFSLESSLISNDTSITSVSGNGGSPESQAEEKPASTLSVILVLGDSYHYQRFKSYKAPEYITPYGGFSDRTSDAPSSSPLDQPQTSENEPKSSPQANPCWMKRDNTLEASYKTLPIYDEPKRWMCCMSHPSVPEWRRHPQQWTVGAFGFCNTHFCIHKRCTDCLWESVERVPEDTRSREAIDVLMTAHKNDRREMEDGKEGKADSGVILTKQIRKFTEVLEESGEDDRWRRVGGEESHEESKKASKRRRTKLDPKPRNRKRRL